MYPVRAKMIHIKRISTQKAVLGYMWHVIIKEFLLPISYTEKEEGFILTTIKPIKGN